MFGGYFQDNWQAAPSLTLNLGLRYEFVTVPDEDDHQTSAVLDFFDDNVAVPEQIQAKFPNQRFAGATEEFFQNPTLKSFSPRVGFAWAPGDRKTSIRGGFGIFYEFPVLLHLRTSLQELPPFTIAGRLESRDASRAGRPLRMFPQAVTTYADLLQGRPNIRYMEYDWKNTYILRWNLNLQRELTSDWVASAGYTGSRGVHLITQNIGNIHRWIGWPNEPQGRKQ